MKKNNCWFKAFALFCLIAVCLLTTGESLLAQIGNRGIPVRCRLNQGLLAPGASVFLTCNGSDGTSFVDGQRVPANQYLLVTDISITPDTRTTTGLTDVIIYDAFDTGSYQSPFRLKNVNTSSFGFSFSVPFLVLHPNHRLLVVSSGFSDFPVEINVSGLLTSNLLYLPVLAR